jgi:hypothetical protein
MFNIINRSFAPFISKDIPLWIQPLNYDNFRSVFLCFLLSVFKCELKPKKSLECDFEWCVISDFIEVHKSQCDRNIGI